MTKRRDGFSSPLLALNCDCEQKKERNSTERKKKKGRKKEKSNPSEWKCPRSKSNYRLQMTISKYKNVNTCDAREREETSAKIDLISLTLLLSVVTLPVSSGERKQHTNCERLRTTVCCFETVWKLFESECQLITTVNIFLKIFPIQFTFFSLEVIPSPWP